MPVKIRLMRIGTKHRPFYRIVAVDERRKRTGGYLELIGTYNPLTNPKDIRVNQEKLEEWKKKGAVLSHGFLRILGNAPQKPARKPKKEKEEKVEAPEAVEKAAEEVTPTEEPVIASESEAIPQEDEIATSPTAPRDDESVPAEEPTPEVTEEEKA